MSRHDAVLLDLYGVVIEHSTITYAKVERDAGLEPGALTEIVGTLTDETGQLVWRRLETGDVDTIAGLERIDEALRARHGVSIPPQRTIDALHSARPEAGMVDVLRSLRRRGLRLGILSNRFALEERPPLVEQLDALFDVCLFSGSIGAAKPSPRAYETALAQLGTPPAATLFLDDTAAYVEAAAAYGLDARHAPDPTAALAILSAQRDA